MPLVSILQGLISCDEKITILIVLYFNYNCIVFCLFCAVFHWSVTKFYEYFKFLNILKYRSWIYSSALWVSFTFLYISIEKVPISQTDPNFLLSPSHQPMLPSQKSPAPSNSSSPGSSPFYPSPAKSPASQCLPNLPCHCLNTKMGFLPQLPWLLKGMLLLLSTVQTQTMPFLALFSPSATLLLAFTASQVHSLFHFFLTRVQGLKNAHQDARITDPHRKAGRSQCYSQTPGCPISDGFLHTPTAVLLHKGFQSLCFFTYLAR